MVLTKDNDKSVQLTNGSIARAEAGKGAGRSSGFSILVLDEAAHIDNVESVWASAQPTLSTGGKCFILSTPNGVGNWYHKKWKETEEGIGTFVPIELPWWVHPDRDQAWRDAQDEELGERLAAQECDASFLTSGDTVINGKIIKVYEDAIKGQDPIDKIGPNGEL